MAQEPQTLAEAVRYFSDPAVCHDFVANSRWPNGVACPSCGSMDVRFIRSRGLWACKTRHPRWQFSVRVGTILEDSPLALGKWLCAMWMVANVRNGVSSYELGEAIGVSHKSAWCVLHRIRLATGTGLGGANAPESAHSASPGWLATEPQGDELQPSVATMVALEALRSLTGAAGQQLGSSGRFRGFRRKRRFEELPAGDTETALERLRRLLRKIITQRMTCRGAAGPS